MLLSIFGGLLGAAFLYLLMQATSIFNKYQYLVWGLAPAGYFTVFIYNKWGAKVANGHQALATQINQTSQWIPWAMAPLITFGTLITHFFGGSAGREGTAVQMGGSLGASLAKLFQFPLKDQPIWIQMGVAAGFASVFGTPWAATLFVFEAFVKQTPKLSIFLACFVCGLSAHFICHLVGPEHAVFPKIQAVDFSFEQFLKFFGLSVLFGFCSWLYCFQKALWIAIVAKIKLSNTQKAALNGLLISVLFWITDAYIFAGLGVETILKSFEQAVPPHLWLGKMGFTALTVGSGFKGGEVTPLFFIGASLGNVLAPIVGLPIPLIAALGFCSLFAAATKTPWASTAMGIELFGTETAIPLFVCCWLASKLNPHTGIFKQSVPFQAFIKRLVG